MTRPAGAKRASERLPIPGPPPTREGRTPEQNALLGVGALSLALALASGASLRSLQEGWSPLLLGYPLLFLLAGWGGLLFGLLHLDGRRRARSVARGRLLACGAGLLLLSAPLPASLLLPARRDARAFTCRECGAQGHLAGVQNAWGTWIERQVRLGGQSPSPLGGWSRARDACEHAQNLPWLSPAAPRG